MVALGTAAARCPGPAGPERPARSPCKESYVGPWLPEPLLTAPDVAEDVELADSVSMAMLVLVLETLTPIERAVFVLREGDRCEPPSLGGPTETTSPPGSAASLSPPDLRATRPDQPTPEEISAIRLAWEDLAA